MPFSMYRLSVPVFQRGLSTLSTYLDKAEAHEKQIGADPNEIVSARLAPDMLPLSGQFQRATDSAKLGIGRLAGIDTPRFEDNEATIAELRERLKKTEAFLATISPETMEGSESREVTISPGGVKTVFRGEDYLVTFALPNFFFHVAMAHAILRHQGVAIGKMTYLGSYS